MCMCLCEVLSVACLERTVLSVCLNGLKQGRAAVAALGGAAAQFTIMTDIQTTTDNIRKLDTPQCPH